MNPIKLLRKKLGPVKRVVLDEWPYQGRMKRIPEIRSHFRPMLETLEPLPPFRKNVYEVHMLCGKRDLDMGIWASWSIMRFLDGCAKLYVHSDGTLTEEDESIWRKFIGGIVVVDRRDSDKTVEAALGKTTKHLYKWRCGNWASAQLVDVHFFGEAPTLLIMDSDVLTFSTPKEVMDALTASKPRFAWCRDLRNAYSSTPEILEEVTGRTLPQRLCAGFLVSPRLKASDFLELDRQMELIDQDPRVEVNHYWSCQTYYAMIAAGFDGSMPLSASYSNTDGKTGSDQILRHYVGIPKVRFRYFTEGLPRLIHEGRKPEAREQ